jgi:hypothetical protein
MALNNWQSLTRDGAVRTLKYSFGFGRANALAVRLDDGSWCVLSPPVGVPDGAFDALAKEGPVRALVAPNGFHHMGQKAWRERFPAARSYAPENALARLAKKCPAVPYLPVSELAGSLGARLALFAPDGQKTTDLLASAESGGERVWYTGDLISNTGPEDTNFLPRMMLTLFGGGGGYRLNRVPAMVYLRDKAAWRRAVGARLRDEPPTTVLPAHGAPVTLDAAQRTNALFGL